MAHYAKIVNDTVVEVTVADQDFINTLDGEWIQTSYNTHNGIHINGKEPLRGNYAGIGFVYDREHDVFYKAKPYPSWSLNTTTWDWEAPVAYPKEDKVFKWDEEIKNWVEY